MINMNVGNAFNKVIHEHLNDFSFTKYIHSFGKSTWTAGRRERISVVAFRATKLILATDRMVIA